MQAECYTFGPLKLYPSEHMLLRGDSPVAVAPKTFEVLLALVENQGRLVTREALMQAVWPDSFVEETNLTVNISLLRKMLGDLPDGRPYIATVPKHGYRFDAPVTWVCGSPENGRVLPAALSAPPDAAVNGSSEPAPEAAIELPSIAAAVPVSLHPQAHMRIPRGWTAAAAASLLGLAAWSGYRLLQPAVRPPSSVRSLAVLPFQPLDLNPGDEYLGLGMTDALITRMDRLPQIVVRPLGAVRSYQSSQDPLQAGRKLGVEDVLDGTVQRLGGQTRVTARLVRVRDGAVVWSGAFDEQPANVFALEDTISQQLAQTLEIRLSDAEQHHLGPPHTPSRDAYSLYTQGRFYWNKRSVGAVEQSIALFEQAIAADPGYAAAYAGLSDAYLLAGSYGNSFLAPAVAMPKAREAAEKALALDPGSPEAHTSLAYIRLMYDRDWTGAEREFKQAIALNPSYVNAHHWYSHLLAALGRMPESYRESETALSLDPTDAVINEHMAWHHMMAREYGKAIPQAMKAIELDPALVQAHRVLALAYLYSGRTAEACAGFQRGVELSHDDPVAEAYLARCYASSHREQEARDILEKLKGASDVRYISASEIAAVYAELDDAASTALWLNKAFEEHASALIYVNIDRSFDCVRADPRVRSAIAQLQLPQKDRP